ncbi:MAG: acylphosphatase [Acidimicrobiia bacterium]|nr:acylphosphatase [Acidimicrobiia bacterium]
MIAVHAFVSGRVQGVFFRQSTRRRARELDLLGWVRNRNDGRVELFAQGDDEAVDRLLDWLWYGPPQADVTDVESSVVEFDKNLQDFVIAN